MIVLFGILGLRHNDAAHLVFIEVVADSDLLVISLIALRHHNTITTGTGFLLNARQHRSEIIMHKLRNDDSYHFKRLDAVMAQSLANYVWIEVVLFSIILDAFALH